MIATLDTLSGLHRLALPALVVVDDEDTSIPPAAAHALAEALHTSNMQVILLSAHFTNLDAPTVVNKLLADFFDSLR